MPCWCGGTGCKFPLFLSYGYRTTCRKLTLHRRYVWGDDVAKAKTQCESLDYLFQLAVEMHKLGLPWVK